MASQASTSVESAISCYRNGGRDRVHLSLSSIVSFKALSIAIHFLLFGFEKLWFSGVFPQNNEMLRRSF